jgi:hypothetical protein
MLNAIVVFSKNLNSNDTDRLKDLTSAKRVEPLNCDKSCLSVFAEHVLEKENFIDIDVYRLEKCDGLSFLASSELRPIMCFKDVDQILESIETFGDIVTHILNAMSALEQLEFATDYMWQGKNRLGWPLDHDAIEGALEEMRTKFEADLDDVISQGRDYYAMGSQIEF